jgi:hypothetical protein
MMPKHDFSELLSQYPEVISQMPETFTSHQFILELAHQNQTAYVEALFSYRNNEHRGVRAPFMIVHRLLAQYLSRFPELVKLENERVPSKDIFRQSSSCAEWQKVA